MSTKDIIDRLNASDNILARFEGGHVELDEEEGTVFVYDSEGRELVRMPLEAYLDLRFRKLVSHE